jgi:hypothetical protein
LPTPPTSGKVDVVLVPDVEDVAAVIGDVTAVVAAAVSQTDLPTPPSSLPVALPSPPTQLLQVEEPCMTPTTHEQQDEVAIESAIDRREERDAKVDPSSEDIAAAVVVADQSPSMVFEMILEAAEEADVSGTESTIDKEDIQPVGATTTNTTTITTTSKDLSGEQKEQEADDEQEDIVANLAIESAPSVPS